MKKEHILVNGLVLIAIVVVGIFFFANGSEVAEDIGIINPYDCHELIQGEALEGYIITLDIPCEWTSETLEDGARQLGSVDQQLYIKWPAAISTEQILNDEIDTDLRLSAETRYRFNGEKIHAWIVPDGDYQVIVVGIPFHNQYGREVGYTELSLHYGPDGDGGQLVDILGNGYLVGPHTTE